ncbi:hypothetical protein ABPG74_017509 [Tetrahymena malaccensis]
MDYKDKCYFKVPDERDRKNAIGSLAGVPIKIKKAIQAIQNEFKPIDAPQKGDWLWDHEEQGQPYEQYVSTYEKRCFNKENSNTIYIQPLEQNMGFNKDLKKFCKAFFKDCKVKVRQPIIIQDVPTIQRRINEYTQKLQLNTKDILNYLKTRLPKDAVCMIGITNTDLYPQDEWNYVFGQASLIHAVGVFSFARYMYKNNDMLSNILEDQETIIYRACKIMVHEISHMFGLRHCIYFKCVMNGCNHQEESDKSPLELCVICLRKLQNNIGFSMIERYQDLIEFSKDRTYFSQIDVPIYEKLKNQIETAYGPHYSK